MAGFSNAAMCDAAAAIIAKYKYGQLHTAAAGGTGVSNVATSARVLLDWGSPTSNGDFDIDTPAAFTGGAASGPVYSVTLWDQLAAGGTFGGEFVCTGDDSFNAAGEFNVNSIAQNGTAS